MPQKKLLLGIIFSIVISSGFLIVYALPIVAPEKPRGGDEAAGGFINNAEESDANRIQVIVNFTTTATNSTQGASIGNILTLLNGTAGQQGILNFTNSINFTLTVTEFDQKSYNFTLTKALLGNSDGPFELHAQINNGTAGTISSSPGLIFTLDTTLPIFSSVSPSNSTSINSITSSSDVSYTLSETVASGTITMTRTGGTADGSSPRTCTLTGTALNSGAHNNFDMSNTTNGCTVAQSLVDGAIYTFVFNATDPAGNAATTVSRTSVTFDTTAPTFTASTATTTTTTITFNESINGGNFVAGDWLVAGVAATGISPSGAASGQTSMILTHAAIGVDDTPSIQYTPGNLADSAGNLVAGNTITASDGNPSVVPSTSGGGSGNGNNNPPSFTRGFSEGESPFMINGQEIDILNFEKKVDVTTLKTGETTNLTLLFYDDDQIDYVGLYTNLRGHERERHQSDTIIEWRSNDGLSRIDPHGYFEDVKVVVSDKGNKNEFSFDITFANVMEKSDLIVYVWDVKRNSFQTSFLDMWQVIESPESSLIVEPEVSTDAAEISTDVSEPTLSPNLSVIIDQWAGYLENTSSDSEMLQSIGLDGEHIPSWTKKLGGWVNEGLIDKADLINALKNLHKRGIVN